MRNCQVCKVVDASDVNFPRLFRVLITSKKSLTVLCNVHRKRSRLIDALNSLAQKYKQHYKPTGEQMPLPRPTNANSNANSHAVGGNLPFLKVEHLSEGKTKEAKIRDVREDADGKFGPAVVVKLTMDARAYLWTLRPNNPNYALLINAFGSEPEGWKEKKILLGLERDEFTEKLFPRVSFPAPVQSSDGRRAK